MSRDLERCFQILGLSPEASWDEVKQAFRGLARRCHPDVAGPSAALEFQKITSAYMTIREKAYVPGGAGTSFGEDAGSRSSRRGLWSRMAESWERWKVFHRERDEARQEEIVRQARQEEMARQARQQRIAALFEDTEKLLREIGEAVIPISKSQGIGGELLRLQSDLPAVRSLAVEALLRHKREPSVQEAFCGMLRICTEEEFLQFLHQGVPEAMVERVALLGGARCGEFSEPGGLEMLRWIAGFRNRRDALVEFLRFGSGALRGEALRIWPPRGVPPEGALLGELLRQNDEAVLVPLLRMLRGTPLPAWVRMGVQRIAREHDSSTVRVWAKALVSRPSPMYNGRATCGGGEGNA